MTPMARRPAGPVLLFLACCLVSALLGVASLIHAQQILDAAVPRHFPPHYSLDEQGRPTGFAIDVMERIAAKNGLEVRYHVKKTWKEVQHALRKGDADIIPNLGITDHRKKFADFTSPVETFPVSIFVRVNDIKIRGMEDLTNHKVAVVETNAGNDLIKERRDIERIVVPNKTDGIFLLLSGQVDALIYPEPLIRLDARKAGIEDRLKTVGKPLLEIKRGIAVAKGNTALLRQLDQAVKSFVSTGEYKQIYTKWYAAPTAFWTSARVAAAMGALLAVILGAVVLWRFWLMGKVNRELRDHIAERKRAEEALAKREREYRSIFENAPVGIFKSSREGRYLSINPLGAAMFGYDSPRDMIETVTDIGSQVYADIEDRRKIFEILRSQGTAANYECGMKRKDGAVVQASFSGSAQFDATGEIEYVEGFITDIAERKRTEQTLNLILEGTAPVVGEDFFRALAAVLARGLNMRYALVGELTKDREHVQTLAVWADGKPGENMKYALRGTPCETATMTRDECHFPEKVTERFPEDRMLLDMKAESYLGVALRDSHGKMIGVLALVHDAPARDLTQQAGALLKTFGARAGAELERKRAEEALRDSEQRFRSLFENTPVAYQSLDAHGLFLDVNPPWCSLTGYEPEEVMGKPFGAFWTEESRPMFPERFDGLLSRGEIDNAEIHLLNKDGKEVVVTLTGRVQRDSDGEVVRTHCILHDITERKRMEDALKESELKFRSYFDLGVVGMAINDPNKQWLEVNDRLCDMLGYSREEFSRLTWVDVTHPDDLPQSLELFEQVRRKERDGYVLDKRYIRKDGEVVNVLTSAKAVRKPEGDIEYLVVLVQDITELKQAEGALVASEERYRTVFDSVGDIIQIHDLEGRILDINQAACSRLGYSHEELTGMNIRDIDGPESAAGVEERLARIRDEGHLSFEVEHVKRDGSSTFTELNSRLMAFEGKDTIFSVGRDITERKQMEQAMAKARDAAEAASKAKSEFLANMSHEIRTPLNGVLGMLQLLQTMSLGKEEQEYIHLALTSGKGLLTIINDILSFSKIEAGMLEIKRTPFDIFHTLQSVMEIFRGQAREKGLDFRYEVDNAMPPSPLGGRGAPAGNPL